MRTKLFFAKMAAMRVFIAAVFIFVLFGVSAVSQTEISPAKKELIHQFAALMKMNEVDFNMTFSADGLKTKFSDLIENDKQLAEAQKAELRRSATEAIERINLAWTTNFSGDSAAYQQIGIQSAYEICNKAFTDAELKDLIAFYSSPLGKKAVAFTASFRPDLEKAFLEKATEKMKGQVQPLIDAETDALAKKIKDAEKGGK